MASGCVQGTIGSSMQLISMLQVFFIMGRICLLGSYVGLIISVSAKTPVNCQALYVFNAEIFRSSQPQLVLCFERSPIPPTFMALGAMAVAHWTILIYSMFLVRATWEMDGMVCSATYVNPLFLRAVFYYTMAFDLVICAVAALGIGRHADQILSIWQLMFDEGLIFFLITAFGNILPAVFATLDLNAVMNIIATIPAGAISTIAAGRSVIMLPEIESDLFIRTSALQNENTTVHRIHAAQRHHLAQLAEVRVNTEQIVMQDFNKQRELDTVKGDREL
ncbi:hypothetical protein EWM64_g2179 [Hericium alpestre]|uniref:G-protein coupled receptors family 1 profile domain-containing protein n=1 Tax=Hericium alpestre TaxID=135208 RepID=A0A4Z0A533_9AGAM|nr:hypothetical protein EWM64_g2179 [Hericium alpestre]